MRKSSVKCTMVSHNALATVCKLFTFRTTKPTSTSKARARGLPSETAKVAKWRPESNSEVVKRRPLTNSCNAAKGVGTTNLEADQGKPKRLPELAAQGSDLNGHNRRWHFSPQGSRGLCSRAGQGRIQHPFRASWSPLRRRGTNLRACLAGPYLYYPPFKSGHLKTFPIDECRWLNVSDHMLLKKTLSFPAWLNARWRQRSSKETIGKKGADHTKD